MKNPKITKVKLTSNMRPQNPSQTRFCDPVPELAELLVSDMVNAFAPESRVWASKRAWQMVPSRFNGFAITGKWRDLDGAVLVGIS